MLPTLTTPTLTCNAPNAQIAGVTNPPAAVNTAPAAANTAAANNAPVQSQAHGVGAGGNSNHGSGSVSAQAQQTSQAQATGPVVNVLQTGYHIKIPVAAGTDLQTIAGVRHVVVLLKTIVVALIRGSTALFNTASTRELTSLKVEADDVDMDDDASDDMWI